MTTTPQPPTRHSRTYLRTRTAVRTVFYTAMSAPLVIVYVTLLIRG